MLFSSYFAGRLSHKRIRQKCKVARGTNRNEKASYRCLGLLTFDISFVCHCCEDTVKERRSSCYGTQQVL